MKVRVYRNVNDEAHYRRFGMAKLPNRIRLVWAGPIFILITR